MKSLMKWTALALALCAGALAQTASAQTSGQSAPKPKANAFPIGSTPEVQVGQTYTAETFGDWEILCVKAESGTEPCEIGQLVLDDQANPIADMRVFPLPPGTQAIAGSTIVLPLGVMLANGAVIAIDDKKPRQYPYSFCNNVGCIARVGFTAIELQALRKGTKAKLTFVMAANAAKPITVPLSLKGFATAYAALSKRLLKKQ